MLDYFYIVALCSCIHVAVGTPYFFIAVNLGNEPSATYWEVLDRNLSIVESTQYTGYEANSGAAALFLIDDGCYTFNFANNIFDPTFFDGWGRSTFEFAYGQFGGNEYTLSLDEQTNYDNNNNINYRKYKDRKLSYAEPII